MCILNVDLEMTLSEEVLVTVFFWAFEDSVIDVGAFVFFETDRSSEGFSAARKITKVLQRTLLRGCCGWGARCDRREWSIGPSVKVFII